LNEILNKLLTSSHSFTGTLDAFSLVFHLYWE